MPAQAANAGSAQIQAPAPAPAAAPAPTTAPRQPPAPRPRGVPLSQAQTEQQAAEASAATVAAAQAPRALPIEGEFVALFSSWEVLYHHVTTIALQQGYRISKRRSSAYKDGKPGRVDLSCDHGGAPYKSVAVQRKAHSRKTACPWKARAVCMHTLGDQWKFVVMNGHHNHPPKDQLAAKGPKYKKKGPPPPPVVQTGVQEAGEARAAEDPLAKDFMESLETVQERERERVGQNVADALTRIEKMLGEKLAQNPVPQFTPPPAPRQLPPPPPPVHPVHVPPPPPAGPPHHGPPQYHPAQFMPAHLPPSGPDFGAALARIEICLGRIERFDQRLQRIEEFGGRLTAIEKRLEVIEKEWE